MNQPLLIHTPPSPAQAPPPHATRSLCLCFVCLFILPCCERSSYCAKVHRSLKAQESDANGTAVWMGQNAHEMIYTCPDCQELAESSS